MCVFVNVCACVCVALLSACVCVFMCVRVCVLVRVSVSVAAPVGFDNKEYFCSLIISGINLLISKFIIDNKEVEFSRKP